MNERVRFIVKIIEDLLSENIKNPPSIVLITESVNKRLKDENWFGVDVTPKLIGSYLRKYFFIEIERRGHKKTSYPIITPLTKLTNVLP